MCGKYYKKKCYALIGFMLNVRAFVALRNTLIPKSYFSNVLRSFTWEVGQTARPPLLNNIKTLVLYFSKFIKSSSDSLRGTIMSIQHSWTIMSIQYNSSAKFRDKAKPTSEAKLIAQQINNNKLISKQRRINNIQLARRRITFVQAKLPPEGNHNMVN